jgi:DNA-binding NarL/FixJ family response regulator
MPWKGFSILETSFSSSLESAQRPGSMSETSASTIGLVVAGHHPLILCGLSQVFQGEGDCRILATCTDGESALDAVRRHQPDIVILDVDLPRNGACGVLRRMRRERLSTRVVLLAVTSEDSQVVDAVRLGARAVVLKEMPPEALVTCVRKVHGGEQWLDGLIVGRLVSKLFRGGTSIQDVARQLTPREAEIARFAVEGIPTRDIAARLSLKQGTVKIHLHSIYDKLNVGGRLGLILFARRHGLV